jgi:osmotically-inducible protein OsmY
MVKRMSVYGLAAALCLGLAASPAYPQVASDAAVTAAVKTRLTKDRVARNVSIDVDTNGGVVTLSGTVPTEGDRTRIGNLVARTTGVARVQNDLTVSGAPAATSGKGQTKIVIKDDTPKIKIKNDLPKVKVKVKDDTTPKVKKGAHVVTDASITGEVKTRLLKDKVARDSHLDVDTRNGVVTITGTVPTAADKARIGRIVEHTTGVKRVANNLTVGR